MENHASWNLTGDKRNGDDAAATADQAPSDEAPLDERHQALAEEFDAWAEAGRADSMETGHMPTAGQALARIHLDDTKPEWFLDLGCGNGYAVRWAAERMHPDGRAIGIDVAPGMVTAATRATAAWEEAREELWSRAGAKPPESAAIVFEQATFDALPFADDSVDHVFSNEAIYYAPDIDAAMAEIRRVLKPGGTLHVCIDHFEENTISHSWSEKVGIDLVMDSRAGWRERFLALGLVDVRTVRLLDPTPVPPMTEEQRQNADWQANYPHLIRWKKEVGSLLIEGRAPSA